ncbi:hypothetical protein GCM10007086_30520 [Photobacterium aphoticum]|nr:hypothetical protein GCM10007086_30520 [Photobacterium aphoticum]
MLLAVGGNAEPCVSGASSLGVNPEDAFAETKAVKNTEICQLFSPKGRKAKKSEFFFKKR